MIKGVQKNHTADNIMDKDWILFLRWRTDKDVNSHHSYSNYTESLNHAISQTKLIKDIWIGKEEIKLLLLTDNMPIYLKTTTTTTTRQ